MWQRGAKNAYKNNQTLPTTNYKHNQKVATQKFSAKPAQKNRNPLLLGKVFSVVVI